MKAVLAAFLVIAAPADPDADYDARLRRSAEAARAHLGPLTGGWILRDATGPLFGLELADDGVTVEGAWRDLRRAGVMGLIETAKWEGDVLILGVADARITFRRTEGLWVGDIEDEGGRRPARLDVRR